jgi:rhodanese-related sulfurtransferase
MKSLPVRPHRLLTCFLIAITGLLVISVLGCATGVSREELMRKMQVAPLPLVVDVRSQGEYDKDHIPGAVHIPFYSVRSGIPMTGYSKNDPIVLYCEHGPRSGIASLTLYLSGYEQIYSLDGHMKGWRANGFPVEVRAH